MTLSENLHNLGTLMKTNLEKNGIIGLTGNEGLTTLANKILDISSSKGITLQINVLDSDDYIIPPIIQEGQYYKIMATLLDNNRPIINQTIECTPDGRGIKTGVYGWTKWGFVGTGAGSIIYTISTTINGILLQKKYEVLECIAFENVLTQNKTWNIPLNNRNFAIEFTVHPESDASIGRIMIQESSSKYILIGDLYANASCGVQWTNGTFYGKAIPTNTDTKITLKRIGTNMTLTVGETTYNISNMPITCNTLSSATISSNTILNFMCYPI